jgi:hypothetical protein
MGAGTEEPVGSRRVRLWEDGWVEVTDLDPSRGERRLVRGGRGLLHGLWVGRSAFAEAELDGAGDYVWAGGPAGGTGATVVRPAGGPVAVGVVDAAAAGPVPPGIAEALRGGVEVAGLHGRLWCCLGMAAASGGGGWGESPPGPPEWGDLTPDGMRTLLAQVAPAQPAISQAGTRVGRIVRRSTQAWRVKPVAWSVPPAVNR